MMPERRWLALLAVALVVLCGVAFSPLPRFRFIQDDHPIVQLNPLVREGTVRQAFATDYWQGVGGGATALYRPVTIASFVLTRGADGEIDPHLAHGINIGLHACAAWLLAWVALAAGAGRLAAAAAALLFALHPLQLAAVAPLTGRAELFALLFMLLGLASASRALDAQDRHARVAWALAAAAAVFLAMGSKETGLVVLPLLLWLYAARRPPATRWWTLAPAFVAAIALLLLRAQALGAWMPSPDPHPADNPLVELDGRVAAATRLALLARYLGLWLWPARLSADYSGPSIPIEEGLLAPWPLVSLLALAALGLAAAGPWLPALRARRPWSLAAVLLLLPYLVVGNLFVLIGVQFAERLFYAPSAGAALLAGLGVSALAAGPLGKRLVAGLLALALLAAAGHSWRESWNWKNEETLFTAALRATPRSPRAHYTLAQIQARQGRTEEAIASYGRAAEAWPRYATAWYERGVLLARAGRFEPAARDFARVVELSPDHPSAAVDRAIALQRLGRLAEAERGLRTFLARRPRDARGWAQLGHVLLDDGRPREALQAYERAVAAGHTGLADAQAAARARL